MCVVEEGEEISRNRRREGEKETRQRDGGRTESRGWVTLDVLRVIDYKVSIPHH